MSVEEFYLELKKDIHNNEKIMSLANSINLSERYAKVDALTLAIFYQHKDAFHKLLDRNIDIQPKNYKEIPPILWSLEIDNTYYFEKLINHKKTDIFITSKTKGENILSNMCIKLNDIWLFKNVFNQLRRKDYNSFKKLVHTNVYIDDYDSKVPLLLCLKYLNDNNDINSSSLENITLEKIKTILDFEGSLSYYSSFNNNYFLSYLFEESNICSKYPEFVQKCLQLLMEFPDFMEFINSYPDYFKVSIKYKIKSLFDLGLKEKTFYNPQYHIYNTILYNNCDFLKILIDKGFKYKPQLCFETIIRNDNLEIFQYMLGKSNFNGIFVNFEPIIQRYIHRAIRYGSYEILKYLTTEYGDDMDYKGICNLSPREFLEYCHQNNLISEEKYQIMNVKTVPTAEIMKLDKHNQTNCCICLDEFESEDICILTCGHIFHTKCALTNFSNSNTCPMCRQVSTIKYISQNDKFTKNKENFRAKMEIIEREILIEEVRTILLKSNISKKKTLYINEGNIPSTPIQHLSYRNALIHNTC